jgi:hypothetical protein
MHMPGVDTDNREAARLITYRSAWLSDTQGADWGNHCRALPSQIHGWRGGEPVLSG